MITMGNQPEQALSDWMHNLKDIRIADFEDAYYRGKAMQMGAGVQGFEAYAAAHEQNLVVVGGECPTVGLAGGFGLEVWPRSRPSLRVGSG